MKGFIAHLDYNLFSRNVDLQFAMFLEGCDQPKMVALPFGEGSLLDAMNRVDQVDDLFMGKRDNRYIGSREEYRKTFSSYAPASPVPVQRRTGYAADRASAETADIQRRGEKPQGTTGVGCRCPRLQCHPELQKS